MIQKRHNDKTTFKCAGVSRAIAAGEGEYFSCTSCREDVHEEVRDDAGHCPECAQAILDLHG